jgi:hypothetical protein
LQKPLMRRDFLLRFFVYPTTVEQMGDLGDSCRAPLLEEKVLERWAKARGIGLP